MTEEEEKKKKTQGRGGGKDPDNETSSFVHIVCSYGGHMYVQIRGWAICCGVGMDVCLIHARLIAGPYVE